MDFNNYFEIKYRELVEKSMIDQEFLGLYDHMADNRLKGILASLQKQFNNLFKLMNSRLPTRDSEAHFWAEDSRQLIFIIELAEELLVDLKGSQYEITISKDLLDFIEICNKFLSSSGGSTIPTYTKKAPLFYTKPVFLRSDTINIIRSSDKNFTNLKFIGEGSYAKVLSFHDNFLNKTFVLKRAKSNLTNKELDRFRREFSEMKKLNSPYVVEVYKYIEENNEYTMEFMDISLCDYIIKNNNTLQIEEREGICYQIFKSFGYLEKKKLLHRDISPNNILIKKYDDVIVVKISDFGLVKVPNSDLTSMETDMKGAFNDPVLVTEGFGNYSFKHEVYALTKLIYFVLTGKTNVSNIKNSHINNFVNVGLAVDKNNRYKSIDRMLLKFKECMTSIKN